MPILNEPEMLAMLDAADRVLLIEPPYQRKYPPLGLMKIAAYVRERGGKVKYSRGCLGEKCDLIAITSLFTYTQGDVYQAIKQAQELSPGVPVLVGGVFASLRAKELEKATGAFVFKGFSPALDAVVPDYTLGYKVDDPWNDFAFSFTTRGCPNKCGYCAVPIIEPGLAVIPNWRDSIVDHKKNVMLFDNNPSAAPKGHIEELVDFLVEQDKRVLFDNGFDVKYLTPKIAALLSRLKFTGQGMRIAFDRITDDGAFQEATQVLLDAGIPKAQIMAYVLFNFKDTPQEAHYRMTECRRLGVRPYPQKYLKLNRPSAKVHHVGKHWTPKLLNRFRHYWLMPGIYTKHRDFDAWLKQQDGIGAADLAAWRADAGKFDG